MKFFFAVMRAVRLAVPKVGVAYMAVLLAANFNRIAITELEITAVLITALVGLHYFLSPFQVIFGWLSDRAPLFGLRRTPYMIAGAILAGSIFPALPGLLVAISQGSFWAAAGALGLILLYGIGLAAHGDTHHALMADLVPERQRGPVVMLVWLFMIVGFIASSIVQQVVMPDYRPEQMQLLYNLAPLIVVGSTLVGVLGLEQRASRAASAEQHDLNPLRPALRILSGSSHARAFLAFIFLAMLGIFLQDGLLEVFGAEQFGLRPGETAAFTQSWNVGALIGMIAMGAISGFWQLSKRLTALLGGLLAALGLVLLALCAYTESVVPLHTAITVMGLGAGVFNIGALTLMMQMTTDSDRGTYMGLWGMSQAFGMGLAALLAGVAHTALIEWAGLRPAIFYAGFFGVEGLLMLLSLSMLRFVGTGPLQAVSRADLTQTMAMEHA